MTATEIPPPKKRASRVTPKKLWERLSIPQSIAFVGGLLAIAVLAHALPAPFWESLMEKMPMDTAAGVVVGLLGLLAALLKLFIGGQGIAPAAEPGDES